MRKTVREIVKRKREIRNLLQSSKVRETRYIYIYIYIYSQDPQVVQKSLSPCIVLVLLVPKKDGKCKMCCDYLQSITSLLNIDT